MHLNLPKKKEAKNQVNFPGLFSIKKIMYIWHQLAQYVIQLVAPATILEDKKKKTHSFTVHNNNATGNSY